MFIKNADICRRILYKSNFCDYYNFFFLDLNVDYNGNRGIDYNGNRGNNIQ